MKRQLTLRFGDEEFNVVAHREGDRIIVERDEERYEVQLVSEAFVLPVADAATAQRSAAALRSTPVAPDAPAARSVAPAAAVAAGPGAVVSPMVGVVKEVLVAVGDQVKEADRVVVMEAMKMDIDVVSPCTGTVAEVSAAVGASVAQGQQLLRISAGGGA